MKNTLAAAAVCLLALPVASQAQDFSGAMTLGYGNSNISDIPQSLSALTLDGRMKVEMGSGLSMGARLDSVRLDIDDVPDSLTGTLIGIDGAYKFGNGMSLGLYAEQAKLSMGGGSIKGNSFGLTAGYSMNGLSVDGYVGRTDSDLLPSDVDMTTLGLGLHYEVAPNLTLGGSLARTRIGNSSGSLDMTMIGVAAAYQIDETWTVFGGASRMSLSDLDADVTNLGLGVSYDMASKLSFPAVASLELARTSAGLGGGDGSLNTVRIGLTIPLGKSSAKVPLNSVADSIFAPSHSVLSSAVLASF